MTLRNRSRVQSLRSLVSAGLTSVLLAACGGPALVKVARQDPASTDQYAELASEAAGSGVTVYRHGQPIALRLPRPLQPGDEVETEADSVAVIRYSGRNEVLLDRRTRVRVGSLDVLFGRIFARIQGLFSVESETLIAGVEGTAFAFSVDAAREVTVTVLDGTVVCSSKSGAWTALRLSRSQTLVAGPGGSAPPRIFPTNPREIDELRGWVARVDRASPPPSPRGFCCDQGGSVFASTKRECRGWFALSERDARARCQALQPGYCCLDGRVTQSTRARCGGTFFPDQQEAARSCKSAPSPAGYCCVNGQVLPTARERCTGRFFLDRASAEKSCRPPPSPTGYCCSNGQLRQTTQDRCSGSFYTSADEAKRRCGPQ